jgi:hypothetical protein
MAETATLGYNAAMGLGLAEEMRRDPNVFVLGQGMVNGGWFGTERGLINEFGAQRVLDTNISEAFQAGLTAGAAIVGMKPVINMGFGDFALIAGDEIFHKLAKWRYMHGLDMPMTAVVIFPIGTMGWRGSRAFELHRGARHALSRTQGRRALKSRGREGSHKGGASRAEPGHLSQRAKPRLGQGRGTARPGFHRAHRPGGALATGNHGLRC